MKVIDIPINLLEDHPDNPRRELGDLSELAASIKEGGVRQNLTVIPSANGKYRVIIGHRRYHAAKLAGLEEVPCTIEQMSEAEQLATMMAENMQRTDLTVSDQVYGTQCMMDLGLSEAEIADKTGLSKDTIKKRAKIAKIGYKNVVLAEQNGVTIMDMVKIAELDNEEDRNEAMKCIADGGNLAVRLRTIKDKRKATECIERVIPLFDEIAERLKDDYRHIVQDDKRYVRYCGLDFLETFKGTRAELDANIPDECGLYYTVSNKGAWSSINIYRDSTAEENAKTANFDEEQRIKDERKERLEGINKHYLAKREEWLCNSFNGGDDNGETAQAFLMAANSFVTGCSQPVNNDKLQEMYGQHSIPNLKLLIVLEGYLSIRTKLIGINFNWVGGYLKNEALEMAMSYFVKWGYPIDEEEQKFYDGTSDVWKLGGNA